MYFFRSASGALPNVPSFPTRRSSDLARGRTTARRTHPRRRPRQRRPTRPVTTGRAPTTVRQTDRPPGGSSTTAAAPRSEEHTSELQSQFHLVCRLLLEKKNRNIQSSS